MKKILYILISFILILTILAACGKVNPAEAPSESETQAALGGIQPGTILFWDNFQDANTDGWKITSCWDVQQNGDVYNFSSTGKGSAFVPRGIEWEGEYALRASYMLTQGTLGFSFNATIAGRYCVVVDSNYISLQKEDGTGDSTLLAQAQAPDSAKAHRITMVSKGGVLQVYVDRQLQLAYTDSQPLTAGTIIIGSTDSTQAWVDNVLVNKVLRPLPDVQPVSETATPASGTQSEVAASAGSTDAAGAESPGQPLSSASVTVSGESVAPGEVIVPDASVAPVSLVTPSPSLISMHDNDMGITISLLPTTTEDLPDIPSVNVPSQLPQPDVSFTISSAAESNKETVTIDSGDEVIVRWDVENADAVCFNNKPGYPFVSSIALTPYQTTTYCLNVYGYDDQRTDYEVTAVVRNTAQSGGSVDLYFRQAVTSTTFVDKRAEIYLLITNGGSAASPATTVRWYPNENDASVFEDYDVSPLDPGDRDVISFTYTYSDYGTKHWKAVIDPGNSVAETDESNNTGSDTAELSSGN